MTVAFNSSEPSKLHTALTANQTLGHLSCEASWSAMVEYKQNHMYAHVIFLIIEVQETQP